MGVQNFVDRSSGAAWLLTSAIFPALCSPPPDGGTGGAGGSPPVHAGKALFDDPLPDANGRSCATCHRHEDHLTLTPERVEQLLAERPDDPLFHRLDADDPNAATLTFEHLQKGLIRVTLPLPDNIDVVDVAGNVITPPDRRVSVWRGVPSVENTAYGAPFQSDGRLLDLEDQARAALEDHSEVAQVERGDLELIAGFERTVFSSDRARQVAELLKLGIPDALIALPEDTLALTPEERRGRDVFVKACQACHGGGSTTKIVNRAVHDLLFNELKPDGNVRWTPIFLPGLTFSIPVQTPQPNNEFINGAYAFQSYRGQIGRMPQLFNASVDLPRYRFRFYRDPTRREKLMDLPPIPVPASDDPYDKFSAVDEFNGLIAGPNLFPQWFTTDPGRALITGNPLDFEGFDVPQLRGIAHTAPYFHDNSHATLEDSIDTYSREVLPFMIPLLLPASNPPETPNGPKESLTVAEKADLLAFLKKL
ncbi:MAG TPA: cytochrome c peroxidase [Polyangiaceae bacterium]